MDEPTFWGIIAKAQAAAGSLNNYADGDGMNLLQRELEALDPQEIVSFQEIFAQKYRAAYRWDLWGAAYVIRGGCSDDGFMDFRSELISRGKQVYEAALADPESLADAPGPAVEGLEGWQYLPIKAYKAKVGSEFPVGPKRQSHPRDPIGEPWDEETVNLKYPKLAKKFG